MKGYGFHILTCILLVKQVAAGYNLDSLQRLLAVQKDTERINTLNHFAYALEENGDFDRAIGYCNKVIRLSDSLGYKRGLSSAYNCLGIIAKERGEYPKSIEYELKTLKLKEELGDRVGVSTAYINIGNVYFTQHKFDDALQYYYKALRMGMQIGNNATVATSHGNIGIVFNSLKRLDSASVHYEKCLGIRTALNDRAGMAACYANIGILRWDQGKLDEALDYMFRARKMSEQLGNKVHVVINDINIGEVYLRKKEFSKGIDYITQGLDLARQMRIREKIMVCYESLSEAYKLTGDYARALDYYDHYVITKDSLINEENNKSIAEMQARYEMDKKQREIELLTKDNRLRLLRLSEQEAKTSRQTIAVWGFGAMGLLLLALTFFVLKSFLHRRSTNLLLSEKNQSITQQKDLIEQKNRQITASLDFARGMQERILPPPARIQQALPEHFVLFTPKDIVSGDFYWLDGGLAVTFLAAIDCTGHGVPGALMSLHAHDMLERICRGRTVQSPSLLLDELNEAIKNSIKGRHDVLVEKFGMDMAAVKIDLAQMKLEYAGARNPVYLVRKENSGGAGASLIELKADRVSIGSAEEKFTHQIVALEKGDMVYLFSDGYYDQVGGPNRKKFLSGNFKELLLSVAPLPANAQKEILLKKHLEWKSNYSQTDDVMVIGVRV